jgi:hypothetical protein
MGRPEAIDPPEHVSGAAELRALRAGWAGDGLSPDEPEPERERRLAVLRGLTPAARLRQALELGERVRRLMRIGLRQLHAELDEAWFQRLWLEHRARCHKQNF